MAVDLFEYFPELAGVRVAFGLKAQGHLPTIEAMLVEGKSWVEIGAKINWCPKTAQEHYERFKAAASDH